MDIAKGDEDIAFEYLYEPCNIQSALADTENAKNKDRPSDKDTPPKKARITSEHAKKEEPGKKRRGRPPSIPKKNSEVPRNMNKKRGRPPKKANITTPEIDVNAYTSTEFTNGKKEKKKKIVISISVE